MTDDLYVAPDEGGAELAAAGAVDVLGVAALVGVFVGVLGDAEEVEGCSVATAEDGTGRHCEYHGLE